MRDTVRDDLGSTCWPWVSPFVAVCRRSCPWPRPAALIRHARTVCSSSSFVSLSLSSLVSFLLCSFSSLLFIHSFIPPLLIPLLILPAFAMDTATPEPDLAPLSLKDNVGPAAPPPLITVSTGMAAIAVAENDGPAQLVAPETPPAQQPEQQNEIASAATSIRSRTSGRSHVLAEIPSAYDLLPTAPAKNGARSIDSSSSDGAPSSSGHSSVNESKHRFERLPDGSHRHNLSAPKRHQFLSSQVRRFRDLLEGRKDKEEHHHNFLHLGHHIKREVMEHPLSLMKEKIPDFEGEAHLSPASSNNKKLTVKEEFLQKYGDLQQVVGRGNGAIENT